MTTDILHASEKTTSGTGMLTAKFYPKITNNDYLGIPRAFVTNREEVVLHTRQHISGNLYNMIQFRFRADIENKRYEFQADNPATPSVLRYWHHNNELASDENVGHIDIEDFDFEKGTLKATFNFTIIYPPTGPRIQVIGTIDVAGMEIEEAGARSGLFA